MVWINRNYQHSYFISWNSSFWKNRVEEYGLHQRIVRRKDGQFVNHVSTLMNPKRDVGIVDVIYHIR